MVDAYDGTVTMYVWDEEDPLVKAYAKAFPELFSDEAMPKDLEDHVRYPEDLFRVQTSMWGRYHVDNADDFYNSNDEWAVALDPDVSESQTSTTPSTSTQSTVVESGKENRIDPYYQLMRLPDEEEESFLIMRPFVPASSDDRNKLLTAFMSKPDGNRTFEMRPPCCPRPFGRARHAAVRELLRATYLMTRAARGRFRNMLLSRSSSRCSTSALASLGRKPASPT